jgi:hypothetical protein
VAGGEGSMSNKCGRTMYDSVGFVRQGTCLISGSQGGLEIICKVLKINIGGVGVLIKW